MYIGLISFFVSKRPFLGAFSEFLWREKKYKIRFVFSENMKFKQRKLFLVKEIKFWKKILGKNVFFFGKVIYF